MLFMLLKTKIVKGWFQEDKNDMDVDTTTSGTQTIAKHPLHARARDLLLIFLIDQKRYNEVTWLDFGPFFFILFPHLSHCGF